MKKISILFLLALAYPALLRGQTTHPFKVVGNGATRAGGGTYQLSGTVGQVGSWPSSGNTHIMLGGFWYRTVPVLVSKQCVAGPITREVWKNVPGTSVSSIPINTPPTTTTAMTSLEAPSNVGDNYGVRIRGLLCIPEAETYVFFLAANDNAELWIGDPKNPGNKIKIASVSGGTNPKEWSKYPSQESPPIMLNPAYPYYFEILHKEGTGSDHVAVGWRKSSNAPIEVIPGSALSPYSVPGGRLASQTTAIEAESTEAASLRAYPNPFTDQLTLEFTATETGPATMVLLDVKGAPVKQLLAETVPAGQTKILTVDGRDLRPGVYLVRLTTGQRVTHKRLLLVR